MRAAIYSFVLHIALALAACATPPTARVAADDERAAMQVLDDYMATFNARDAKAWAATLNYPHVRIAGGEVKTWATADDYARGMDFNAFAARSGGWARSEWNSRRVIQSAPGKVHFAVRFSRYGADGAKLADYESLYVVTLKEGHWGVQARSSFAP